VSSALRDGRTASVFGLFVSGRIRWGGAAIRFSTADGDTIFPASRLED